MLTRRPRRASRVQNSVLSALSPIRRTMWNTRAGSMSGGHHMPGGNHRMRTQLRRLIVAPSLAAIFAALLLPAAAAAASPIQFGDEDMGGLVPGSSCLNGAATPSSQVHLTWKSAGGAVKDSATVANSSGGHWVFCSASAVLATGDRVT